MLLLWVFLSSREKKLIFISHVQYALLTFRLKNVMVQSAGTVEYTDCISAERYNSPNKCPRYDTKQSDGEASVDLELWGMPSTPSLPSLPDPLKLGVVALELLIFI